MFLCICNSCARVFMCICICVRVCLYGYYRMPARVFIWVYVFVCACVYMGICMCACVLICVYEWREKTGSGTLFLGARYIIGVDAVSFDVASQGPTKCPNPRSKVRKKLLGFCKKGMETLKNYN